MGEIILVPIEIELAVDFKNALQQAMDDKMFMEDRHLLMMLQTRILETLNKNKNNLIGYKEVNQELKDKVRKLDERNTPDYDRWLDGIKEKAKKYDAFMKFLSL